MLELNKTYNMDCLEGLKLLDDNSIDLTVTSPPYDNLTILRKVTQEEIDLYNQSIKKIPKPNKLCLNRYSILEGGECNGKYRKA